MPTVDNLDIQISTSLKNTDKQLDNLIKKLGTVSSSLSRVGGTTSNVSNGMTRISTSATRSTKSFNGLAAAFGRFYANYFLVVRGIKALYKSIEGTADYIEAFNYFEVSFNKIASEWKQDYKKFGYDNAEAYAESFNKRAKESLSKLSGVQIDIDADGKGILTETGMKNLGLNIQEITQYASQLASVTNSVGQTGEVSLAAANSFTKLAGDISSLFNQDYSAVAKNLQSGLIGQSRALYKYGIDITNATLQTYAFKLGLEKEVSEMTQAEKMQLRMIAILDQSKVSWGDLANTIDSPSNMIRQFKNNLKEAGMVLGQLFVPLLSKVLPVINGITIAIKRLLVNIAGFLGIELDLSSFGQGGVEIEDTFDDVSDSLDNVADSAKKAKAGLRGFDELKTINMPESSKKDSGGLGGAIDLTDEILKATSEYEKVWNKAYEQMENKAQAFADSISKYLEPVKKLFQDIAIGDWFAVGEDVSNIVSGIFDFFSRAIESVDWEQVGTNIGLFLAGIDWTKVLKSVGRLIWEGISGAIESYKGMFDAAPIETGIITAVALLGWTGLGKGIVKAIVGGIGSSMSLALAAALAGIVVGIPVMFGGIKDAIQNGLDWLNGVLIPAGATAAGAGIGAIIGMLGGPIGAGIGALIGLAVGLVTDGVILIVQEWDKIKEWFSGIGEWFSKNVTQPIANFFEDLWKDVSGFFKNLWEDISSVWGNVSTWFNDKAIEPTVEFFKSLWRDVSGFFKNLWEDISSIWATVSTWFSEKVIEPLNKFFVGVYTRVSQIFKGLWIIIKAVWIIVSDWFKEHVVKPIKTRFDWLKEKVVTIFTTIRNKVKEIWEKVSAWFSEKITTPIKNAFTTVYTKIKDSFTLAWTKVKETWKGVKDWFSENIITPIKNAFGTIYTKITNVFSSAWTRVKEIWKGAKEWFGEKIITPIKNAWKKGIDSIKGFFNSLWSSIKSGVVNAMNGVIAGIEAGINLLIKGINAIIKGFNRVVSWASKITGDEWDGVDLVKEVSIKRIQKYEVGGFPKSADLFWANENGIPELIGTMGGKTAVASGMEITGIKDAILQSSNRDARLMERNNQLLSALLEKEYGITDFDIGKSAQRYARDYFNRTGKEAYSF